jgi:hypothetical protein
MTLSYAQQTQKKRFLFSIKKNQKWCTYNAEQYILKNVGY